MIFRDESSQFFYQSGTEKSVIDFYNNTDRFVLNNTFSSQLLKNVLVRRYLKIPELFANIGGFIKAINILAQFLVSDYSTFTLYNKLHDELVWRDNKKQESQVKKFLANQLKSDSAKNKADVSVQNINQEGHKEPDYKSYCFWLNHRFFKFKNSLIDMNIIKRHFDIGLLHQQRINLETRLTALEEKILIN